MTTTQSTNRMQTHRKGLHMGQIRAYDEREYRYVAARIGDRLELPEDVVKRLPPGDTDDGPGVVEDLNQLAIQIAEAIGSR